MVYSRNFLKYCLGKIKERESAAGTPSIPDPGQTPDTILDNHQQQDDSTRSVSSIGSNVEFVSCNNRHDEDSPDKLYDEESICESCEENNFRAHNTSAQERTSSAALVQNFSEQPMSNLDNEDTSSTNQSIVSTPSTASSSSDLIFQECIQQPINHEVDDEATYEDSWSTPPFIAESCSIEIMRLLDQAGSPRCLYKRLMSLLNKQYKNGFNVSQMMSRQALINRLSNKFKYPEVQSSIISGYDVYRFPFVEMLQDLLDTNAKQLHIIDREQTISETYQDTNFETVSELWNTQWMKETFLNCAAYHDFDQSKEIILPLIIYMDKTGVDQLQRYSLEPVLFTTAAIPRERRESAASWRHLGFIPPPTSSKVDGSIDSNHLQLYHNFLSYLISEVIAAQKHPPTVTIEINGERKKFIARLPLMIIMGDQKSQDTLCCRKHSNSGGAGRIHRSCMCSYLSADNSSSVCVDVCLNTIQKLTNGALMSSQYISEVAEQYSCSCNEEKQVIEKYMKRQRTMFSSILQYPFTQHAIRNAFDEVDFGAWRSGIFTATFDDFMHSTESGLFEYTADVVYGGLTLGENKEYEDKVHNIFDSIKCSARSTYPRWRIQDNFTNQTRMTCGEKVGSILLIALSLQYKSVADIFSKGHSRQRRKYITFFPPSTTKEDQNQEETLTEEPPPKKRKIGPTDQAQTVSEENKDRQSKTPFHWERYMHSKLSSTEVERRLTAMILHGLDIEILGTLDSFQLHLLLSHCNLGPTSELSSSYPKKDIPKHYTKRKDKIRIPVNILNKCKAAVSETAAKEHNQYLESSRFTPIEGTIQKHYRQKTARSGIGSTVAILSRDVRSVILFMEYLLCFHSFCRYSSSLPSSIQQDYDLIDFGSRTLIRYFEKMVYRGDESVDTRTTKVHSNKRVGLNFRTLGSSMHADCQTGERLLKTKAKSISATAQQRGNSTFENQTMHRIQEETLFARYGRYLLEHQMNSTRTKQTKVPNPSGKAVFARRQPNFQYDQEKKVWLQIDKKGKVVGKAHIHQSITSAFLEVEPNLAEYEIHSEVQLPDGSRIRATPNYCKQGPWYDYVNVKWDIDHQDLPQLFPCRCLAFYEKKVDNSHHHSTSNNTQLMALVHSSNDRMLPSHSSSGRSNFKDTLLTSHFYLEYVNTKEPKVYAITVDSIESAVLCLPHHIKKSCEVYPLFDYNNVGIMRIRPRNEWAYVWMAWNEVLQSSNSTTKMKGRKGKGGAYVDLANEHEIRKVKKKLEEYLSRHLNVM